MDDTSERLYGIKQLLHSRSKSKCTIHEMGATVLGFHPSPDRFGEQLFVSQAAYLDGSKAIRGGIPLVFPIFGTPADGSNSDMPQHGFARINAWTKDEHSEIDNETEASVEYRLVVDPEDDKIKGRGTKGLWAASKDAPGCELRYKVAITDTTLKTTLTMKNTSTTVAFPVQALFHTYYHVHNKAALDGDKCFVKGLADYSLTDKVDASNTRTEDVVTIQGETDRVYTPSTHKYDLDVAIGVADRNQSTIQCKAKGTIDQEPVPISAVVWNPYKEKAQKMKDFGNEQYHEMICVEPGMLRGDMLQPGKVAVLEQTISVSEG